MTTAARADREVIRAAAAAIRHIAAQDQYRNGQYPPTAAFNMALVLDELALHATSLPDDLRAAVAAACRRIIKDGADDY